MKQCSASGCDVSMQATVFYEFHQSVWISLGVLFPIGGSDKSVRTGDSNSKRWDRHLHSLVITAQRPHHHEGTHRRNKIRGGKKLTFALMKRSSSFSIQFDRINEIDIIRHHHLKMVASFSLRCTRFKGPFDSSFDSSVANFSDWAIASRILKQIISTPWKESTQFANQVQIREFAENLGTSAVPEGVPDSTFRTVPKCPVN